MKKLIYFELRKIFSKRLSMVTLIGILLFSALLSFSTYQNKYAFDQNAGEGSGKAAVEIDKEIAAKYEGILTDEKVRQMMSDFAPTSDLHGLNAAYIYQNAMQSAAFSRFSDLNGNWNGLSVSDVFGNEEIKIGYVDGWLSTSRNMVRVFTALAFAVMRRRLGKRLSWRNRDGSRNIWRGWRQSLELNKAKETPSLLQRGGSVRKIEDKMSFLSFLLS